MGQQGSKSTIEARVVFQRVGAMETCQKKDTCSSPTSVVRIQKKMTNQACRQSSNRALEKSAHHSWPHSSCDAGGLVYVIDSPTGGVWVKPGEKWSRSWYNNENFSHCANDGSQASRDWLDGCASSVVASSELQDASDLGSPAEVHLRGARNTVEVDLYGLSDMEKLSGLICNLLIYTGRLYSVSGWGRGKKRCRVPCEIRTCGSFFRSNDMLFPAWFWAITSVDEEWIHWNTF